MEARGSKCRPGAAAAQGGDVQRYPIGLGARSGIRLVSIAVALLSLLLFLLLFISLYPLLHNMLFWHPLASLDLTASGPAFPTAWHALYPIRCLNENVRRLSYLLSWKPVPEGSITTGLAAPRVDAREYEVSLFILSIPSFFFPLTFLLPSLRGGLSRSALAGRLYSIIR